MSANEDDSWEVRAFEKDTNENELGCTWPPRSYICTFCRREFRSAQALGGHMNVHRRDRVKLHDQVRPPPLMLAPSSAVKHEYSHPWAAAAHEVLVANGLCLLYNNKNSMPLPNPNAGGGLIIMNRRQLLTAKASMDSNSSPIPNNIYSHDQYHTINISDESYTNNYGRVAKVLALSCQSSSSCNTDPSALNGCDEKDSVQPAVPDEDDDIDLELRLGRKYPT